MAISETTLKDVMLMLIEQQNAKGGVLGRKLEAVVVDPASNWPLFAEKARGLLSVDKCAAVFGYWTSVSRKSVLLRHAHRAAGDAAALNAIAELAAAVALSRERQAETLDQGAAFVAAAAAWHPPELPVRVAYPVAVGALAGWHRIAEDATAAAYLQAFASNLISAAVRLVPLGQSAGLRVLAALEPVVVQIADASRDRAIA